MLDDGPGWGRKWACLGVGGYKAAQFKYLLIFIVSCIVLWLSRRNGEEFDSFRKFSDCKEAPTDEDTITCFRKEAVLRISFVTFVFFLAQAVIVFVAALVAASKHDDVDQACSTAHSELFTAKILCWVILCIIVFFTINSAFFSVFFQVARVIASIYLLIQLIIILETAFAINDKFIDRDDCKLPGLALSATIYFLTLGGLVALYVVFAPSPKCVRNIAFITVTLILAVVCTGLSFSDFSRKDAGIFTAGLICAYATYLTASSLYSGTTSADCSVVPREENDTWIVVTGFVIALVSLIISCFRTALSHSQLMSGIEDESWSLNDLDNDSGKRDTIFHFHFTFASATCFMLMTFTGWSLEDTPGSFDLDAGRGSMYAKIAAAYACFALYIWILIAPKVLSNRVF